MPKIILIRDSINQAETHEDNLLRKINFADYLTSLPAIEKWRNQVGAYFAEHGVKQLIEVGSALGDAVQIIASYLPDDAKAYGIDEHIVLSGFAVQRINNPRAGFKFNNYTHLSFDDASVDGLYIEQSLYMQEDLNKLFAELNRVLAPQAKCILCEADVSSWQFPTLDPKLSEIFCNQLSKKVAHANMGSKLPELLTQQSFTVEKQDSFRVVIDDLKVLNDVFDFRLMLSYAGLDADEANKILHELEQQAHDGEFLCDYANHVVFAHKN